MNSNVLSHLERSRLRIPEVQWPIMQVEVVVDCFPCNAPVAVHGDGEVLGEEACIRGFNDYPFEGGGEVCETLVGVQLGTVCESAAPCEDAGDRVGAGLPALLMHAVVSGHSPVSGLGLDSLSVWAHEHRGHEAQ